jgi:hypothetical protein
VRRSLLIGFAVAAVLVVAVLAGCGGAGGGGAGGGGGRGGAGGGPNLVSLAKPMWCPISGPDRFDVRRLLGQQAATAYSEIAAHRCVWRVIERDGTHLAATADFRANRVDLAIRRGVVTGLQIG